MGADGYLLLEGGAEFGGQMAIPDTQALTAAGGPAAPVVIIPAAAAPDGNDVRAGQNGVRWFRGLGAERVEALPLIDRDSADDPAIAAKLRQARLIYLLGGFPGHLAESLQGSTAWMAILASYRAGAVIAGSSAGAMVLCAHFFDPVAGAVKPGLGLLDRIIVIPHYEKFGRPWSARLQKARPASLLVGIDEETGVLGRGENGAWQVFGRGRVTVLVGDRSVSRGSGEPFRMGELH